MFGGPGMFRTMDLLERGLDGATLRKEVIANNIANVDVPHFKRSEVSFEMNLKRALESREEVESIPPLQTNQPGHIDRRKPLDYHSVHPTIHVDTISRMRNDGNNVDIEDEVAKLTRNQLQYNLMVDRIGGNFRLMHQLIRMA